MKKAFLFLSIFLTATFINAQESGETGAVDSEYDNLNYNPYTGKILPFDWGETIPDIEESDNHPNGFDGLQKNCYGEKPPENCYDPSEQKKIPIFYISIETGKTARFIFNEGDGSKDGVGTLLKKISPYSDLRLLREKKAWINPSAQKRELVNIYKTETERNQAILDYGIDFSVGNKNSLIPIKIEQIDGSLKKELFFSIKSEDDEGVYTLIGKSTKSKRATWTDLLKIHIKPYKPLSKEFIYIELDGGDKDRKEWDPLTKDPENSITLAKTLTSFNNVYKQAAVNAKITVGREISDNKDIVIDKSTTIDKKMEEKINQNKFGISSLLIEVDMSKPEESEDNLDVLFTYAKELFAKYGDLRDKKSKYRHIVFAINKERKSWPLEQCITKDKVINLTLCNNFYPELEPSNTKYYITRPSEDCRKTDREPIKIPVTIKKGKKDRFYYAIDSHNELMKLKSCDILHTDNGLPIIPGYTNAGLSFPWTKEDFEEAQEIAGPGKEFPISDNFMLYDDYLPYGSIIIATRNKTDNGLYTIAHELGHSFGLTDIVQDSNEVIKKRESEHTNTYGTTERNLMTWINPSGSKIRYRDNHIACTNGKDIILTLYLNKTNGKMCKTKDEKNEKKCLKILDTLNIESQVIEKTMHENQWECFRDCYKKDFSSVARAKFWLSDKEILSNKWGENISNECQASEESYNFRDLKEKNTLKKIKQKYNPPIYILQAYYTLKELKKEYTIDELKDCINIVTGDDCFK